MQRSICNPYCFWHVPCKRKCVTHLRSSPILNYTPFVIPYIDTFASIFYNTSVFFFSSSRKKSILFLDVWKPLEHGRGEYNG